MNSRKGRLISLIVILVFLVGPVAYLLITNHTSKSYFRESDSIEFHSGDLVFRRGKSFVSQCGDKAGNSPGATAKKFTELFADGKTDKAMEMINGYSEASDEEKSKLNMFMAQAQSELEKKDGIKSVEVLEEEINEEGDEAEVKLKTTYGNGETEESEQKLVKVDGKWKIAMEK